MSLPSLFSLMSPATSYQWLFAIYCYAIPILLYGAWASVAMLDMLEAPPERRSAIWGLAVLLVPLVGGAAYLLTRSFALTSRAKYAIVIGGLIVWLIPLTFGVIQVWGPLGPKALN
jgi:hypothetical protein